MRKFHRAIRPADTEGEYFLYNIEYIKDGIDVRLVNSTIHVIDKDGKVGENILPPELVFSLANLAGVTNMLHVDGVLKTDPDEEIEL